MQAVAPPHRQSLLPPPPVAGAPRFVIPLRILHPETARLHGSAAATSLVPTPGSVFGSDRRFLGSFFPDAVENSLLENAVPLTAWHGFVLVQLAAETLGRQGDIMAMFNLLAGTCDVLPPLKGEWSDRAIGCAILTGADCSLNGKQQTSTSSAFFKLLIITTDIYDQPCKVCAFTFDEASWSTLCEFSFDDRENRRIMHPTAVVCRGMAHWLDWYNALHTLDVDVETCQVSRTKIHAPIENIMSKNTHDLPHLSVNSVGRSICYTCEGKVSCLISGRGKTGKNVVMQSGSVHSCSCNYLSISRPKPKQCT
jgi:hypothetical protein